LVFNVSDSMVKTGIQGFDELIEGGLPRGYGYTIMGGPGSGKTIFAIQFIYNGATKYGENGVYVSFDESLRSIRKSASNLGMDLTSLEKNGQLIIVDASPIRVELGKYTTKTDTFLGLPNFDIDTLMRAVNKAVERVDAKRIVVDPISSLTIQYRDPFVVRRETMTLISSLSQDEKYTSLFLSEVSKPDNVNQLNVEAFLTNGVVILHNIKQREEKVRAVEILKMRGVNHSVKMHPFKITDKGIVIYPKEKVFST
jgi:KaiC/GvpD/RAD55 family RecA-like ATPase